MRVLAIIFIILLLTIVNSNENSNLKKRKLSNSSNLNFILPKCTSNKDCSDIGICSNGFCKCDKAYVTYIDLEEQNE